MSIAPIFKKWARGTLKSLLFSHYVVSDSFATLWTTALQAPLSMGFPRQEYWSGLPFPSPGNMSNQGIEPAVEVQSLNNRTAREIQGSYTLEPIKVIYVIACSCSLFTLIDP